MSSLQRALAFASSLVVALFLMWVTYLAIRMIRSRTPTITLDDDSLVIRHTGLFRKPVSIPRSDVGAVDVDVGTDGGMRPRERFANEGSDEDDPASVHLWLYSRKHGSPLPVVGHFREIPNLAVILDRPQRFEGVLRVSRPLFRYTVRSPIRTKEVRGFLVAARDPFIAEQQFRAWGTKVRHVSASEAHTLLAGPRDRTRERYRTIATVGVGIAVYIAYLVYTLVWGEGGGP